MSSESHFETGEGATVAELAAYIVCAYVSKNTVVASELPNLIESVAGALSQAAAGGTQTLIPKAEPIVAVKKSIVPDYIICLEDGKKFRSLKRHLRTHHDLSPDEYRQKWSLPRDYPMVAPNYAAARSALAKKLGFGQRHE